ncbi:MAG: zincin-like metallopeptidase domain-containing protein [Candidatus Eremiobacteraeota bacterium]|nr:zincin-like metallopeptidase domain-containing protein [Candidatus Eremiobacteraeota bacterium]
MNTRQDIYACVTAEIVAAIQAGAGDWNMPWHHDGSEITRPANVASGKGYRGINTLALWIAAQARGFGSGLWGTYRQWNLLGGQVRKGEHATAIVFWKRIGQPQRDHVTDASDVEERRRFVARGYAVFNRSQVDGYDLSERPVLPESERIAHADTFLAALNIPVTFGSEVAFYQIAADRIFMPAFSAFHDATGYVSTYVHESAHATGAKHRLDRDFGARFSGDALAVEEITAELTAALVLADLGIAHHPRADHAAYVASWLNVLKNDTRAIFTAASKAQAAADWMHAQQSTAESGAGVSREQEVELA